MKVIVMKRVDGGVSVIHPTRPRRTVAIREKRSPSGALLHGDLPAETEKQYLDEMKANAIQADSEQARPMLIGAVEVVRGNPDTVLPPREDRGGWEVAPGGKTLRVKSGFVRSVSL